MGQTTKLGITVQLETKSLRSVCGRLAFEARRGWTRWPRANYCWADASQTGDRGLWRRGTPLAHLYNLPWASASSRTDADIWIRVATEAAGTAESRCSAFTSIPGWLVSSRFQKRLTTYIYIYISLSLSLTHPLNLYIYIYLSLSLSHSPSEQNSPPTLVSCNAMLEVVDLLEWSPNWHNLFFTQHLRQPNIEYTAALTVCFGWDVCRSFLLNTTQTNHNIKQHVSCLQRLSRCLFLKASPRKLATIVTMSDIWGKLDGLFLFHFRLAILLETQMLEL